MGRAFEFRKDRKMKRWGQMAKTFTKFGREISLAVKSGGGDPTSNSRLRTVIQNAKTVNMPKDRIEAAIKRASSKDEANYTETLYEGYGPYGIAVMVECATDNVNRTVANLRVIFSKGGGSMGATGSVAYLFDRKSVFKFDAKNQNIEDLELELIDFGLDNIFEEDGEIFVYAGLTDFSQMQTALEERKIEILSAELNYIPKAGVELGEKEAQEVFDMIDKLEDDEDVQNVYHNIA